MLGEAQALRKKAYCTYYNYAHLRLAHSILRMANDPLKMEHYRLKVEHHTPLEVERARACLLRLAHSTLELPDL